MWCRRFLYSLLLISCTLELTSADEDEDNPFFLQAEKSIPRIGRQPKEPNKGSNDDFTNFFMKASKSVPRIGRRNEASKADNKLPQFMLRIPGKGDGDKYIKSFCIIMVQKKESCGLISYVPSNFKIHKFIEEVMDHKIIYQVIKMVDSVLIFVNYKDDLKFQDLSLAIRSRYDSVPVQTQLVGNLGEDNSRCLAGKLSRRLNKTVYISSNITQDKFVTPMVEKALFEEIKRHPDSF